MNDATPNAGPGTPNAAPSPAAATPVASPAVQIPTQVDVGLYPDTLADSPVAAPQTQADPFAPADSTAVAPEQFEFGGERFESREKAEQNFRSLRGQFKPMQDQIAYHRAEVDQLRNHVQELRDYINTHVARPAGQGGQQPQAPADPLDRVNWTTYQQLLEQHGDQVAARWLGKQLLQIQQETVQASLKAELAPIQQHFRQAQVQNEITSLWRQAASYTNADGTPAYPELRDPVAARKIAYVWTQSGLDPQSAMSPTGIHLAVLLYRDQMARASGAGAPNPASPSPAQELANAAAAHANSNASAVLTSGNQPPSLRPAGPANPQADILAAIRSASPFVGRADGGHWGFTE